MIADLLSSRSSSGEICYQNVCPGMNPNARPDSNYSFPVDWPVEWLIADLSGTADRSARSRQVSDSSVVPECLPFSTCRPSCEPSPSSPTSPAVPPSGCTAFVLQFHGATVRGCCLPLLFVSLPCPCRSCLHVGHRSHPPAVPQGYGLRLCRYHDAMSLSRSADYREEAFVHETKSVESFRRCADVMLLPRWVTVGIWRTATGSEGTIMSNYVSMFFCSLRKSCIKHNSAL